MTLIFNTKFPLNHLDDGKSDSSLKPPQKEVTRYNFGITYLEKKGFKFFSSPSNTAISFDRELSLPMLHVSCLVISLEVVIFVPCRVSCNEWNCWSLDGCNDVPWALVNVRDGVGWKGG